jgi:hypothetical protein
MQAQILKDKDLSRAAALAIPCFNRHYIARVTAHAGLTHQFVTGVLQFLQFKKVHGAS